MNSKKSFFLIGGLVFAFLFLPQTLFAATLRLSPASGTYNVGQTFSLSVLVNSSDQSMNAASGVLLFPKDILEITGISKGGSVMSLWIKEPSFSNSAGTVNFEGVVLNPGFTGSAGNIITVTFRTKKEGTAPLSFKDGQVLANDGTGENILAQSLGGTFTIVRAAPAPVVEVPQAPPLAAAPRNSLILSELTRPKSSPLVQFSIAVTDKTFFVDYYRISVNGGDPKQLPPTSDSVYAISGGKLGENTLVVRAVSKTGAFLEESAQFLIEGLIPPVITEYPSVSNGQRPLTIKGTTDYPLSTIRIRMRRDGEVVVDERVLADASGGFVYTNAHELVQGEYNITATVVRKDGAESAESTPVIITIENPFIVYLGTFAINVMSALLLVILLLIILIVLIIYSYFRIKIFRRKLRKEAVGAETALKKSMKLLKEDVSELVSSASTAKELKQDIDNVEKFVGKEIREIESL